MSQVKSARDERIAVVNGDVTLSVRIVGSGPLLILVHGFPDLGDGFRNQAHPLAEAGYTVAIPDMRGYGLSSKPASVDAYSHDRAADDLLAIADASGQQQFVPIGHDWGSAVAWRCALRFPDRVPAVVALAAPYYREEGGATTSSLDDLDPEHFFYIRWMQQAGRPEAELERDPRAALKQIFYSISGDAPVGDFLKQRPASSTMLEGLAPPPEGPLGFMDDATLDHYAQAFSEGGFFGPCSWYRNIDRNAREAAACGDGVIRQPAAYVSGEHETALQMLPGILERQRQLVPNLRMEVVIPGVGHWVHQEKPDETNACILKFLHEADPFGRRRRVPNSGAT